MGPQSTPPEIAPVLLLIVQAVVAFGQVVIEATAALAECHYATQKHRSEKKQSFSRGHVYSLRIYWPETVAWRWGKQSATDFLSRHPVRFN
jgi:hypothetical protein